MKCPHPTCKGAAVRNGKIGSLTWMVCTVCGFTFAAEDVGHERKR